MIIYLVFFIYFHIDTRRLSLTTSNSFLHIDTVSCIICTQCLKLAGYFDLVLLITEQFVYRFVSVHIDKKFFFFMVLY